MSSTRSSALPSLAVERDALAARLDVCAVTVGYRTVLHLDGQIDVATTGALDRVLNGHIASCVRDLWVDLSSVTFMDSDGVHALLRAHCNLARDNRRLAVICPPGAVRRVLRLAGTDALLPVFPDRATAHRAH